MRAQAQGRRGPRAQGLLRGEAPPAAGRPAATDHGTASVRSGRIAVSHGRDHHPDRATARASASRSARSASPSAARGRATSSCPTSGSRATTRRSAQQDGGFFLRRPGQQERHPAQRRAACTSERRLRARRRDHARRARPHLLRATSGATRRSTSATRRHAHLLRPRALRHQAPSPPSTPRSWRRQNRVLSVLSKAAQRAARAPPAARAVRARARPALRGRARRARRHPAAGGRPAAAGRSRPRAAAQGQPITEVSRSIARRVLERAGLAAAARTSWRTRAFSTQDSILSTGIRSAMCAPLWFTADRGGAGRGHRPRLPRLPGQHARSFTEEDLRIVTALANVAAAKIENVRLLEESMEKRRLEEDMRVAAEIQRGLLPGRARPRCPATASCGVEPPLPHGGRRLLRLRARRTAGCSSRWATSRARARAPPCS